MTQRKFIVPFLDGKKISLVKDEKRKPLLYDREVVEEINKPVRDLINENDKRRANVQF